MNIDKGDIHASSQPQSILAAANRPDNVIAGGAQHIFRVKSNQEFIFDDEYSHGRHEHCGSS